jgi:hypothetical protein
MPEVVRIEPFYGENLTGKRFGRRVVTEYLGKNRKGKAIWMCLCDCGTLSPSLGNILRSGQAQSCGCLQKDKASTNNKASSHPEYRCWVAMISRCYNENRKDYHHYGGRGITVCDRWKFDFFAFQSDMGPRPGPGYSIERMDNHGNYEPGNCVWATQAKQTNNKRNNRLVTAFGKTHTIAEWSRITGLKDRTIQRRLGLGWSDKDSLGPLRR